MSEHNSHTPTTMRLHQYEKLYCYISPFQFAWVSSKPDTALHTWLTNSALACTFGLTRAHCFAMPIFFFRLAHFCGATAKKADTSFDIGWPYFSSSCTLRCTAPNHPSISCALVLTCILHRAARSPQYMHARLQFTAGINCGCTVNAYM